MVLVLALKIRNRAEAKYRTFVDRYVRLFKSISVAFIHGFIRTTQSLARQEITDYRDLTVAEAFLAELLK